MKISHTCIVSLVLKCSLVESFVVTTRSSSSPLSSSVLSQSSIHVSPSLVSSSSSMKRTYQSFVRLFESKASIPTIDQLSSDPFMKQVGYAAEIVSLLEKNHNDDDDDYEKVTELLKAQLSHSDGIRGFFVTYLTAGSGGGGGSATVTDVGDDNSDGIPTSLVDAMNAVESDELIPLVCMNVIMPTAMTSMHTDEELAQSSAQTAQRGIKVLKALIDKPGLREQCQAIYDVSIGTNDDSKDYKYWTEFFEKWGYKEKQREDIKNTMNDLLVRIDNEY